MEKMQLLQLVEITFSYSRARDRYVSLSLKEANLFDYVRKEQRPTHCLTSRHVEIRCTFLIRKVVTVVTAWT
jgi:hypothetical protein